MALCGAFTCQELSPGKRARAIAQTIGWIALIGRNVPANACSDAGWISGALDGCLASAGPDGMQPGIACLRGTPHTLLALMCGHERCMHGWLHRCQEIAPSTKHATPSYAPARIVARPLPRDSSLQATPRPGLLSRLRSRTHVQMRCMLRDCVRQYHCVC